MAGPNLANRWGLVLVLAIPGCGGSSFSVSPGSDGGGEAGSSADAPAGADAPVRDADAAPDVVVASDASPDAGDGAIDAPVEACAPMTLFLDGDGDGYGGTTTSNACLAPDSGAWVAKGGDCDDSNPTVNPGQTAFFAVGYTPTGKSTVSFDYDCDGQETESGSPAKASCAVVSLSCVGSGYIPASPSRTGAGVDPFCGSAEAVTCALMGLACQAGSPQAASPIACR